MPALVGYVDKDLIYRRVNRTYEDWFKIPAEKIVGMHVRELAGDAQYEKTIPYRSRVLKGEHVSFETEFTGPDGEPRWLEANFIPCLDAESSVCGFFALTLDITRRKRAEATMRKQEKLALVGRLASSIAHEINNPLEAVTNLLYLGEIAQETEKVRSYLNAAQQELSRVSQIATLALQFHRPQSEPKLVNICTLLDSVLPLFESRLRNARIEVEKQYRPTQLIPAMEGELRQVFANIISNACDALTLQSQRAKSRIVLRVRDHKDASGEFRVHVTIADDGIGMSSETRRRLFEPFFSTKEDKGTGLGLWISSEIVSKHRGKIRLKSRLGVGTTFRIELPFGIF